MLTGRTIVFVGGDFRMLEVIAQVTEMDASAVLIGFDQLSRTFTDTVTATLSTSPLTTAHALVLPVAGMDDDGRVDSKFADEPVLLDDAHFAAMRKGSYVFTGIAGRRLREVCKAHELNLVKLMELDEVAILNSVPTAEGALVLAMQNTDITIHGSDSVVLGFGRCGQTLARTLAAIGAKVTVCARDPGQLARITEMALTAVPIDRLEDAVAKADLVFNTIPAPVLHAGVLQTMRRDAVIIDIASKPGGTDFRFAERRGMKAILAPSLPGVVAPKTAGRIIANTVCRVLTEQ